MSISTKHDSAAATRPSGSTKRSDATRARLLAAATATFAAKGFHGTSTRDIAQAAGISPTAIYVHHRSKEELLHLISRQGHEEAYQLVCAAIRANSDPTTQVRAVVHDLAVYHARSHALSRVVNYELAALGEEHLEEIRSYRRRITGLLRGLVQDGIACGAFDPPDQQLAVTALMSLTVDIARWYRPDGLAPERVAEAYAEMALRLLGLPAANPPRLGTLRARRGPRRPPRS